MPESKIKKSALSFPVVFEKVKDFETADDRFTKVKIWLMHLGKNLNNSVFEKSVVDKAIPTLQYIPIMGFVELNDDNEKDFSDHRYIITRDEKGIRRKYMGTPYGVIKSSDDNNAHYEERLCEDGETRTFLVTEGIIWNVLEDGAEIFHRDLVKGQSMELYEKSIDGYEDDEGIFYFTDFSFRAACVLGDDVTPAMTGSTVEVQFALSDFVRDIQSELNDKYSEFTKLVNDTALVGSTSDATSFEVANEKTNGGVEIMENVDFTQTLLEFFSDISALISQHEVTVDRWGYECPRYYAVDIQENEVIVVDTRDNYNYYGISFTVEADKPVVDFDSAKRKKLRYEDYEEGVEVPENAFDFGKHISEIENNAFAKIEEANAKLSEVESKVSEFEAKVSELETAKNEIEANYNQVNAEFEEMKPKYEQFVQAEQARIEAELDAQKDAKFAEYETVLAEDVDFMALKEKKAEMTVKEIESECAIMYAKKTLALAKSNFSKNNDSIMTAGLINDGGKDGFEFTKYGYIKTGR